MVSEALQQAGLARVTINAPQARVDLAVPETVPVAELLPELLRHAGPGLADAGERHGGWLLRRTDGEPLTNAAGLHAQGVRDGDVLHLVPARLEWPEPEYDDAVDAVAAGARRIGPGWSPPATRVTALVAGGLAVAAGALARPHWTTALGIAAGLLVAGCLAARGHRDRTAGAVLAGCAMPYAAVGAAAAGAAAAGGAAAGTAAAGGAALVSGPGLLAGCAAVVVCALLGGLGTGGLAWVFAAGATAAALGATAAVLGWWLTPAGVAAVLAAVLALGVGATPLVAVRLGQLPVLSATPPPQPAVEAAVRRTDALLTGGLVGHALVTAGTAVVLVASGGTAGRLLAGVVGGVLLLRARLFAPVHQRVPVLVAGAAPFAALAAVYLSAGGAVVAGGLVALGLVVVAAGLRYPHRPPSPYLGRAADLLDTALVLSVVPVACAVLGLYAKVRGLAG